MTLELAALPVWQPLREAFAELTALGEEFEAFVLARFDRLDELVGQLAEQDRSLSERELALAAEQESLAAQWQRLDDLRSTAEHGAVQVQQEARRLAKAQAEFAAARHALATERADWDERTQVVATGLEGNESWTREKLSLERALAEARDRAAHLAAGLVDLAESRRELAEARRELLRLQNRLTHAKGHTTSHLAQKVEQLETERARLLADLEQVRRQSADQSLDEHRRLAEERTRWADELHGLRAAVDRLAHVGHDTGHAAGADAGGWAAGIDVRPDPVLDLVIAQFEQLQKEMHVSPKPTKPKHGSK